MASVKKEMANEISNLKNEVSQLKKMAEEKVVAEGLKKNGNTKNIIRINDNQKNIWAQSIIDILLLWIYRNQYSNWDPPNWNCTC